MVMGPGGGESIEVGAVSFRIGVDLAQFQRDLSSAEELARQRAGQIQQHFNQLAMGNAAVAQAQMGHGPIARRAVEQAATGQLGLPGFDRAEQLFRQRLQDVQALQKLQVRQEAEVQPTPEIPPPEEPAAVERIRRVKTRDYHTTEAGAPEAVSPPSPVSQRREVETRDVRTSIAPQPTPPPPPPSKVQAQPQIIAIPAAPPTPTTALTPVMTASGQPMFVPSRVSGPTQTQRQVPPTISGIPAAQRPLVHIPPTGLPPSPVPVEPRHGVTLGGAEVGPPAHPPVVGAAPAPAVTGEVTAAATRQVQAVEAGVAQAIDAGTQSLKGQFVQWTGAAGARMQGRVTSEKPGGRLRVNVGGAYATVPREQVTLPYGMEGGEAAPAAAPTETPPAPAAPAKQPRAPRAPKPAPAAPVTAPVAEAAAEAEQAALEPLAYGPIQPASKAPTKPPLVMPGPPALPRSGQPPKVYIEPPAAAGETTQQAYVLAPQGIYQTQIPFGYRRAPAEQAALSQYFAGAPKIEPRQFPPYARYLAERKAEDARREAARVTGATPPAGEAPPPAPIVRRGPTRPGEVQQLPEMPAAPATTAAEEPAVAPLEIRPMEQEASVIQQPAAPRVAPTRTYEFQRSRSVAQEITTGPKPYVEAFREGERPVRTPLSRSEAARQLLSQRRLAQQSSTGVATTPTRIRELAHGGPAEAGQVHLIGEHGPELFIPQQAGYVLSNEQTRAIGGMVAARAGGGDVQAGLFGEPAKPQLPAFGTVQPRRRRRTQQPTGVDVYQPDIFGGAGIERGEGETRAQQMELAREEMRATQSPSLFEAPEAPPPAAPVAEPEPEATAPRAGWQPAKSAEAEAILKIHRLSSLHKPPDIAPKMLARGGPVGPEASTEVRTAEFIRRRGKRGFSGEALREHFRSLGLDVPEPGGKFGGVRMPSSKDLAALFQAMPSARHWYGEVGGGLAETFGEPSFNEARILTAITSPRTEVVQNIAQAATVMGWLRQLEAAGEPVYRQATAQDVEDAKAHFQQQLKAFNDLTERRRQALHDLEAARKAGDARAGRRIVTSVLTTRPAPAADWTAGTWERARGQLIQSLGTRGPRLVAPEVGDIRRSDPLHRLYKSTPNVFLTAASIDTIAQAYQRGFAEAGGAKTPSYGSSIGVGRTGAPGLATAIDTWMAAVFGYGVHAGEAEKAAFDPRISRALHGAVMALAEQYGVTGYQMQAGLWLPYKTLIEAGRAKGTGTAQRIGRALAEGTITPEKAVHQAHDLGMFTRATGTWSDVVQAPTVHAVLERLSPYTARPGTTQLRPLARGRLSEADLVYRGGTTRGEPTRGVSQVQQAAFEAAGAIHDPLHFAITSTPLLHAHLEGRHGGGRVGRRQGGGPVSLTARAAAIGQRLMFHGTASDIRRIEPSKLTEAPVAGRAFYMTSDPRVAGGLIAQGGEEFTGEYVGASHAPHQAGDVLAEGYAQQRRTDPSELLYHAHKVETEYQALAEARRALYAGTGARYEREPEVSGPLRNEEWFRREKLREARRDLRAIRKRASTGPNVTPFLVPQDLKLLDLEKPLPAEAAQHVVGQLQSAGMGAGWGRSVSAGLQEQPDPNQSAAWLQLLVTHGFKYGLEAHTLLSNAGYHGIRYSGGQRIPMYTPQGESIEHEAYAIFPSAVSRVRPALTGMQAATREFQAGRAARLQARGPLTAEMAEYVSAVAEHRAAGGRIESLLAPPRFATTHERELLRGVPREDWRAMAHAPAAVSPAQPRRTGPLQVEPWVAQGLAASQLQPHHLQFVKSITAMSPAQSRLAGLQGVHGEAAGSTIEIHEAYSPEGAGKYRSSDLGSLPHILEHEVGHVASFGSNRALREAWEKIARGRRERAPTIYGREGGQHEDFAESFRLFLSGGRGFDPEAGEEVQLGSKRMEYMAGFDRWLRGAAPRARGGGVDPRKAFPGLVERVYRTHRPYLTGDEARGAAYFHEGSVFATHVTDDPSQVEKVLRERGQLAPRTEAGGHGKYADLGRGLYVSDAPEIWESRSRGKWDFLQGLDLQQRQRLANVIRSHPNISGPYSGLAAFEKQYFERDLQNFVTHGEVFGAIQASEQPYNVPVSKPDFLAQAGITASRQPRHIPVELQGRFARLKRYPSYEESEQLRDPKYRLAGVYTTGGFSTTPQMAVFTSEAVKRFGEYQRPQGSFREFERRIARRELGGGITLGKGVYEYEIERALARTPGAQLGPQGLQLDVERRQSPSQGGERALRSGVFYLAGGGKSPYTGRFSYGGSERLRAQLTLPTPLVVRGGMGGALASQAAKSLIGATREKRLLSEVRGAAGFGFGQHPDPEKIGALLQRYGAERAEAQADAHAIIENARRSGQMATNQAYSATYENIVAHLAREAGHSGIAAISPRTHRFGEVFDVREEAYPYQLGTRLVHQYREPEQRHRGGRVGRRADGGGVGPSAEQFMEALKQQPGVRHVPFDEFAQERTTLEHFFLQPNGEILGSSKTHSGVTQAAFESLGVHPAAYGFEPVNTALRLGKLIRIFRLGGKWNPDIILGASRAGPVTPTAAQMQTLRESDKTLGLPLSFELPGGRSGIGYEDLEQSLRGAQARYAGREAEPIFRQPAREQLAPEAERAAAQHQKDLIRRQVDRSLLSKAMAQMPRPRSRLEALQQLGPEFQPTFRKPIPRMAGGPAAPGSVDEKWEALGEPPKRRPRQRRPEGINPYLLQTKGGRGRERLSKTDLAEHRRQLTEQLPQLDADIEEARTHVEALKKVQRPPWAGALSNKILYEIAALHDLSAEKGAWWEIAGLESAESGEVRELLQQASLYTLSRETVNDREQLINLRRQHRQVSAALQQLEDAGEGQTFYREGPVPTELPFEPAVPRVRRPPQPPQPVLKRRALTEEVILDLPRFRRSIAARRGPTMLGPRRPQLALPAGAPQLIVPTPAALIMPAAPVAAAPAQLILPPTRRPAAPVAAATAAVPPPTVAPSAAPTAAAPAEPLSGAAAMEATRARVMAREAAAEPVVAAAPAAPAPAPAPAAPSAAAPQLKAAPPPSSLRPDSQAAINYLQEATGGTARDIGSRSIAISLLKQGVEINDLGQLLQEMGVPFREWQPLIAELGTVAEETEYQQQQAAGPAAGSSAAQFEAAQAAALARPLEISTAGAAPAPRRAPRVERVAPPTAAARAESQRVLEHLTRRRYELSSKERMLRLALLSGTSIDRAAPLIESLGITQAHEFIEQVRQVVTPPPVAPAAPRGPSLLARLSAGLRGIGRSRGEQQETEREAVRRRLGLTEVQPRAAGGPAGGEMPGVYLVGERGPELFVPHAPGYVLAHSQARRAVAEGRVGRIGHRAVGGTVDYNRLALDFLRGGGDAGPHSPAMLTLLGRPGIDLNNLSAFLQHPMFGVAPKEAEAAVSTLRRESHPSAAPRRLYEAGIQQISEGLGAGPPPGVSQRRQAQVLQQEFREVQQLISAYRQLTGVRAEEANATAKQTAQSLLLQQREERIYEQLREGGLRKRDARRQAREQATEEMQQARLQERPEGAPQRGVRLFGQTATQFIREVSAFAGINLGFNVLVGLATRFHQIIADTVNESIRLQQSTAQLNVAFGAIRAPQMQAAFDVFRQAPLATSTAAGFQQVQAALAPLGDQFQLTDDQVNQLATASSQLASIWGGDQAQAAQVLQQIMRGNVEAGQQYNINITDQAGRIRGLNASYREAIVEYGQFNTTQKLLAEVTGNVNQQVAVWQSTAPAQAKAVQELRTQWNDFQTQLAETAASPVTQFLKDLIALLREVQGLLPKSQTQPGGQQGQQGQPQPAGGQQQQPPAAAPVPTTWEQPPPVAPAPVQLAPVEPPGETQTMAQAMGAASATPVPLVAAAQTQPAAAAAVAPGEYDVQGPVLRDEQGNRLYSDTQLAQIRREGLQSGVVAAAPAGTPQQAAGGQAQGGGAYLVGERGPELFVPSQSGHVYSHPQTMQILGAAQEGADVEPGIVGAGRFLLGGAQTAARNIGPQLPLALGQYAIQQLRDTGAAQAAGTRATEIGEDPLFRLGASTAGAAALLFGERLLPRKGRGPLGAVGALGLAGASAFAGGIGSLTLPPAFEALGTGVHERVTAVQQGIDTAKLQATVAANQTIAAGFGVAADKARGAAEHLPGPLADVGKGLGQLAEDQQKAHQQAAEQAQAQLPQGAAPPAGPAPVPSYRVGVDPATGGILGPDGKPVRQGPALGMTPRTAVEFQQQQAMLRVNEANTRLQQIQAQSQLRLYDVNQSNIELDGRRVSAQEALNRFAMQRLQLESQLVPIQLRQQQIQDQITLRTQENLELRRGLMVAQQTQLQTGAVVERAGFRERQAQLQLGVDIQDIYEGKPMEYDVGEAVRQVYANAPVFQSRAQLQDLQAQQDVYEQGLQVQTDQYTKAIGVIPLQEQMQANEQSIAMYNEQIAAAQASSDAVTRVLQMADLIADPARIAAQRDLNQATLDAANAAEQAAQIAVSHIQGYENFPVTQNAGAVPPGAAPTTQVTTQPQIPPAPGPGTPGATAPPPAAGAPPPVAAAAQPGPVPAAYRSTTPTPQEAAASRAADAAGQAAIAAGQTIEQAAQAAADAYSARLAQTTATAAPATPTGLPAAPIAAAPGSAAAQNRPTFAAPNVTGTPRALPGGIGGGAPLWRIEQTEEGQRAVALTPEQRQAMITPEPGTEVPGQPRQAGGPVGSGTEYLVGERGPELFAPNLGSQMQRSFAGMLGATGAAPTADDYLKALQSQSTDATWGASLDTGAVSDMLRNATLSPSAGNVNVHLNMGEVSINDRTTDIEALRQSMVEAATRGTLQALRQGQRATPMRVPYNIAAGR